ncbi:DUF4956 domain-containing protein [Phycicoccus sp. HDW14]|uniref:DUF4956 domain-containing protein n=1 Tax=Phycicoccus sp. HDW14 TaxID=2714941 RepID=UPI00140A2826|nr:DUF4956 domain-containing protein [Phycicoccus sp. HDW14]QIM21676.1 DUF4956 domain-containing protein [Phycicoccus sp. HDW14]
MSTLIVYAANVVAICLLVFALYVPRHGRRDLVVAYLGVNIGVMAVASALLDSAVGAGLGLGLFGVLSIIRLRSEELAQHEVAYYFAALALGLLSGLAVGPVWLPVALMALIVGALWLGDHPRMLPRHRRRLVVLDHAYDDERDVVTALEQRLGAPVIGVNVLKVDHVNDATTVDVRFRAPLASPVPTEGSDAPVPVRRTTVVVP